MKRSHLTRRALLRGLGAGVLATPVLSSLVGRLVHAETGSAPLRFFLMFTGNGQDPSHWLPTGSETSFSLSPVLEPLAAMQDKLLLLHGLVGANGHSGGMSEATTGWASSTGDGIPEQGPSIDQLFADAWRQETPLASLELGVMPANEPNDQTCYAASGLPLPAIGSPAGAFQRLFDVTNLSPEEAERRRLGGQAVLDVVSSELKDIRGKLGADARQLLDEHLSLVEDRQQQLANASDPLSCELPSNPPSGGGLAATWQAQNDNVIAAFRCGVTRVATLRAGGWGGIESGGYDEIGVSGGHHSIAHVGPHDDLIAINRFHAENLAYLLQGLDAVPEGDGTLLDNTVVVWINELGLGPFNHHSRKDCHVVMAGGANAGLRNGAFLNAGGVAYANLLLSLAHLLGQTQISSLGQDGDQLIEAIMS